MTPKELCAELFDRAARLGAGVANDLAGEAIEDARRAENAERYAHAEPPRDPGGT